MDYKEILEYIEDNFPKLEYYEDPIVEQYTYTLESDVGDTIFQILVPFEEYFQAGQFINSSIEAFKAGSTSVYHDSMKFIDSCKNKLIRSYNEILKIKNYMEDGDMTKDAQTLFDLGFDGMYEFDPRGNEDAAKANSSLSLEQFDFKLTILLPYATDCYLNKTFTLVMSRKGITKVSKEFRSLDILLDYIATGEI